MHEIVYLTLWLSHLLPCEHRESATEVVREHSCAHQQPKTTCSYLKNTLCVFENVGSYQLQSMKSYKNALYNQ